ncbi:phage tail assembly protein [Cronobacter dublinensis]
MIKEITLSQPIMAHGEKLHVLELRPPRFDEVESLGFPFTVAGDGGMKIDSAVALKYIPALAGIPRSSAEKLALRDVFIISMHIMGFFTSSGMEADSVDASTTSPTSGE